MGDWFSGLWLGIRDLFGARTEEEKKKWKDSVEKLKENGNWDTINDGKYDEFSDIWEDMGGAAGAAGKDLAGATVPTWIIVAVIGLFALVIFDN